MKSDVPYHLRFRQQWHHSRKVDHTISLPGTSSTELPNL